MRCIAKDPNDRYQSMGDVQKGLEFTLASSEADKPRLPASEPEKTKEQTKAISKKAFDGRRTHILIVEDDASVRRGLQELLSSEGYDVRTAEDGVHAVSRINAEHPDLVLLDINLPRLNGFEVLRRAKESGYSGPIIMLTARGEQVDKVMGLEIGAVDYVTKPFQAREVVARVRAQLRASQMASRKRPTSSEKRGRRTMCVMFTDMKDFSKIVNRDERKGLSLLREQNRRIARVARRYSGEVIEVIGDAHVISFKSALQAVECGVAIQDSIHLYNRQRVTSDHIRVRIGINVGDVMEEEGKLRGDTVNIAARLQQISRPGCVTISQSVYESIKGRVKVPITKVGQKKVKNIRQPVMIYQARKKVWNSRPT
jgi:DNA-binding response OmpR family regulator